MRHCFTRLLLTQLLLLVCSAMVAEPVSEQQAHRKALEFIQKQHSASNARSSLRIVQEAPELTSVSEGENQPVYMYNIDGGGFVIVSGESRMRDILAYSPDGKIDVQHMAPAMKWWLNSCKAEVARIAADDKNDKVSVYKSAAADVPQVRIYDPIYPRMTTQWGQESPYDTYTPYIYFDRDGKEYYVPSLTGCVATALAQLMNYYGYPENTLQDVEAYADSSIVQIIEGKGQVKDTLYFHGSYQTEKIPANTSLNWDLVRANDADAIARLMQYCGAATKMNYSNMVSLTNNKDQLKAIHDVFGYKDAYLLSRAEFDTLQNWVDRCYLELQYNGPFLMSGTTSNGGGHQFIVDGYYGGLFYINWGWNGDYDGYFYLDILNPYNYQDYTYGFDSNVCIIAGMGANGKCDSKLLDSPMIWHEHLLVTDNNVRNLVIKRASDGSFTIPVSWIGGNYRHYATEYIPSVIAYDEKNKPIANFRLKEDGYMPGLFGETDTINAEISCNFQDGKYTLYSGYELVGNTQTLACWDSQKHPVAIKVDGDNLTVNNGTDAEMEVRKEYKGEKNCFVLLVQFQDVKFSLPNPQEFYTRFCNEKGFNGSNTLYPTNQGRGSVKDYFYDQSDGRFDISFDVLPVITLQRNQEYYGADNPNVKGDYDVKVDDMALEALKAIDSTIDFNKYCWDETKKEVTNFYIVTPGVSQAYNEVYPNLLWPSKRTLKSAYTTDDGIVLKRCAYGTELTGSLLNDKGEYDPKLRVDGIGTMCHEFSHCLGYMDHYDSAPGYYGEAHGSGNFDVMCRGCNNGEGWIPASYSGYERQMASWLDFVELDLNEPQIIRNVKPINRGGDCYVVRNPLNFNEFFTIEVREKSDWDAYLPDSGLMITYINYGKVRWDSNTINMVNNYYTYPGVRVLSPAVPINSLYSEPKKLFHEGDSLTDQTDPYSYICTYNPFDKYGVSLHVSITDIVEHDDGTISFNWMNCSQPTIIQGVEERRDERPYDDAYYTLDGRRLSTRPQHGIYIHRGKKVFIR